LTTEDNWTIDVMRRLFFLFQIFFSILSCSRENNNIDKKYIGDIIFYDIDSVQYRFSDLTGENKNILVFGLATWCHYSTMELLIVNDIDSMYSDKIQILGVDCYETSEDLLKDYISNHNITYPFAKMSDNSDLETIIFSDSSRSVPRLVLINSNLYQTYYQRGYEEYTIDSILKYLE
jgi:thiol-disulfide isomerase/thioredoxin